MAAIFLWIPVFISTAIPVAGFAPLARQQQNSLDRVASSTWTFTSVPCNHQLSSSVIHQTTKDDNDGEENDKPENPYADPNYPDLEFVNYDDPEYQVDQGIGDEFFDEDSTEAQIEEMREDRRRRNDEFQFQTYFKELLQSGKEFKGDWSVYQTSTFLESMKGTDKAIDANGFPRMLKSSRPLYVTSSATKIVLEGIDSEHPTDAERIYHKEVASKRPDFDDDDDEIAYSKAEEEANEAVLGSLYWPKELSAFDFRGEKGIMCVGNAYTICTSVALHEKDVDSADSATQGPFAEYRSELGILSTEKDFRLRVKLDYRVKDEEKEAHLKSGGKSPPPALCLKSMVICREALGRWPPVSDAEDTPDLDQLMKEVFYGRPGAQGGLYDPPPVGEEDQAGKYMLLDLDGGATLLFPFEMEQDSAAFDGNGWVTSLDWTPGTYRYQADRKVKGGPDLRNLRTLELSEVQGAEADDWRPNDGGQDMRQ